MHTRTINLRKPVSGNLIKYHGSKFLNRTDFGCNYIYIRTKLVSEDNKYHFLGLKFKINLKNKSETKHYVNYIYKEYLHKYLLKYNPKGKKIKIHFTWLQTGKNDHN